MDNLAEHLRSSTADLDLHAALKSPISSLLGVSAAASQVLQTIGLFSIFDLGTSSLLAQVDTALREQWVAVGHIPTDVLDPGQEPASLEQVSMLPIEALKGLSDSDASILKATLGVETIHDLANWPPRRAALMLVQAALGPANSTNSDASAERLRPAMGDYPTERVYYDKLLMLGSAAEQDLHELDGAISLTAALSGEGKGKPAIGALVTLSQSWFAQGVTLGHMLHSLALAPGEATRVAMVDWSRRTSAATAESIAESERLDDSTTHSRAISEVQNAVADEMQRGRSMSSGWSESKSKGSNLSGSLGGGVAGMVGDAAGALGFSLGGSSSSQSAETHFGARSSSWSKGHRATSASLTQNVNDRTEQHASSVRSRRATAIREVSQTEHEQISTRVVANYNHMHALTVQYYEVVQVYRVVVRPHAIDRVLFVPFGAIDFMATDALDVVARYRDRLLEAALTPRIADLIVDPAGNIAVRSAIRVQTPRNIFTDVALAAPVLAATSAAAATSATATTPAVTASPVSPDLLSDEVMAPVLPIRTVLRTRRGPVQSSVRGDAELVRISFEGLSIAEVRFEYTDSTAGSQLHVLPSNDLPVDQVKLGTIARILVATADGAADSGTMTLHCEINNRPAALAIPVDLVPGTNMQTVMFVDADPSDRKGELLAHLQANRDYYTRSILEGLDAASLVPLLAGFSWEGEPLIDQVEPDPVTVAGNFLVLRAPVGDDEPSGLNGADWGTLLAQRGVTRSAEDARLVPIPTGGVFAEAVLGRSNGAEKLDITRFWNWQDSPIPLQPPEISPITAGSRATPETLTPGQLGAPVLNIMNPTSLPDPTSLSAILSAVANGNMFRDMSGLAGTQAAGQAMSAGTLSAATEAGRINSDNFKAATQAATDMAKTAADMWKTYQTSDGSKGGSNHSASAEGARINHARDMDERGIARAAPASGSAADAADAGGSSNDDSGGGGSSSGGSSSGAGLAGAAPMSNEQLMTDSQAGVPSWLREVNGGSSVSDVLAGMGVDVIEAQATSQQNKATPAEKKFLDDLTSDFKKITISSQAIAVLSSKLVGVEIKPMRLHNKFDDLKIYFAWTASEAAIYVNADAMTEAPAPPSNSITPDQAKKLARIKHAVSLFHESIHIGQFKAGHRPPKTFLEMANFEFDTYGMVIEWLQSPDGIKFFKTIGLSNANIGTDDNPGKLREMVESNEDYQEICDRAKRMTGADTEIRDYLKSEKMLPDKILGDNDYRVAVMYSSPS